MGFAHAVPGVHSLTISQGGGRTVRKGFQEAAAFDLGLHRTLTEVGFVRVVEEVKLA